MNRVIELPFVEAVFRAAIAKRDWKSGLYRNPIDSLLIDYMAEMFPDEGLNLILGQFPKNDARITTLSLCLFKSQSATTVMNPSDTLSVITESTYTNYVRQTLATATWGAVGASAVAGDGRKATYPQISFPAVGATGDTVNGSFIGWDTGAGGIATPTRCVAQANFDDLTTVTLVTNDVLKVTPTVQINH